MKIAGPEVKAASRACVSAIEGKHLLAPLDEREQVLLRKTIGLRCRKARVQLGLSQRALAKAMGRSPSWVREIESGAQYAPPYLMVALASAAEISVAWLYGAEGFDPQRFVDQVVELLRGRARGS